MTPPTWGRTTFYNGIRMRSRLEAAFAAWLDERELTWRYEPHAFATAHGQYLPDFLVEHDATRVYIEIKPTLGHVTDLVVANRDIIRASQPAAQFVVVVPHGSTWYIAAGDTLAPELVGELQGTQPPEAHPPVTRHDLPDGSVAWLPRDVEIDFLIHYMTDPRAVEAIVPTATIATLIEDPLNATAFTVLATGAPADDNTGELLRQLEPAEPIGPPIGAVSALVHVAAQRARLAVGAPAEIVDALSDVNEPDTRAEATTTLLTWLEDQR